LTEHREDLVRTRTQTVNRLHALLIKLVPAGLPRKLTAEVAAAALRSVRPQSALSRTLRALAVEPVAEIRRLGRCIATAAEQTSAAVAGLGRGYRHPLSAATLTEWRRTEHDGSWTHCAIGVSTRIS
jgi:hypothetical protein